MSTVLPAQPLHIKCIVLGSSGCGKTSILRRVFYNTFDPFRASTVGSDWYTKRIDNPYYFQVQTMSSASNDLQECPPLPTQNHQRKSSRKKRDKQKRLASLTQSTLEGLETSVTKTQKSVNPLSPNRRHRRNKGMASSSSNSQQLTYEDIPQEIRWIPQLVVQMWDTAGLEKNVSANKTHGLTANFGDNFFKHSHVAILVYDATSSRSFTQLIQWHSDLLERIQRIHETTPNTTNPYQQQTLAISNFPVLIVANKLDQLQKERSLHYSKPTVPQRDVIGLKGHFKGDDSRYEYTVSTTVSQSTTLEKRRRRNDKSPTKTLSYSLEGASWTSDHSYLDSIITAEDGSFPGMYNT